MHVWLEFGREENIQVCCVVDSRLISAFELNLLLELVTEKEVIVERNCLQNYISCHCGGPDHLSLGAIKLAWNTNHFLRFRSNWESPKSAVARVDEPTTEILLADDEGCWSLTLFSDKLILNKHSIWIRDQWSLKYAILFENYMVN